MGLREFAMPRYPVLDGMEQAAVALYAREASQMQAPGTSCGSSRGFRVVATVARPGFLAVGFGVSWG